MVDGRWDGKWDCFVVSNYKTCHHHHLISVSQSTISISLSKGPTGAAAVSGQFLQG